MSQTIQNFLVSPSVGVLNIEPRVFSFEIDPNAQTYYRAAIGDLQDAINNRDYARISTDLGVLNTWSRMVYVDSTGKQVGNGTNGAIVPYSAPAIGAMGATTLNTTMDKYMAQGVDQLIRTIRSAGWDPILGAGNITQAQTAFDTLLTGSGPAIYNLQGIINSAISAATQAHIVNNAATGSQSLQQLMMIDYVSTGNTLLFNQMDQLNQAINLNQTSLQYLNSLQDLMNQKDPQTFLLKLQNLSATNLTALTDTNYSNYEQQTFNQDLGTAPKFTEAQLATYIQGLQDSSGNQSMAQGAFKDLTNTVTAAYNYSAQQVVNNLGLIIQQISQAAGSTALTQSLNVIKNDFSTTSASGQPMTVQAWVQDYSTGGSTNGDFQRHLNNAITASQSFNDTQSEELRRVMFVFEEFYKSATAMLSRISQIVEKMASSMSR